MGKRKKSEKQSDSPSHTRNKLAGKKDINDCKYVLRSRSDLSLDNFKNLLMYNRNAQILLLMTIIGAFFRLYNLGFNSLWLDEGATVNFASNSFIGIWETFVTGEYTPPLFYWLEHFMLFFGNNEFVLRLLPALFGILTIPVVYFIGREISDETGGIIAAGLLTFSSFHIIYSQEARAYTLMTFFYALTLIVYLWALKNNSRTWWILFGVFSALSFWSNVYSVVPIFLMYCFCLIKFNKNILNKNILQNILISILSTVIVALPVIIAMVSLSSQRIAGGKTFGLVGFEIVYNSFISFSNNSEILASVFVILMICGLIGLFVKRKQDYFILFCLLIVGTFVFGMVYAQFLPWVTRYSIIMLPIIFPVIGCCAYWIPRSINRTTVSIVALIFILLLSVPFLTQYYSGYSKNDWRGLSDVISDTTNEGDFVVVVPSCMGLPLDYYYSNESDGTIEFFVHNSSLLSEMYKQKQNNSIYYIVSPWDAIANNPEGDGLQWIHDNTQLLGRHTNIEVYYNGPD